jgi:hydrogenase nickel incorporation protein HypA/HybF
MHELSIAHQIVEIVGQHVPDADTARVKSVTVRIGEAAGVVAESLEFCFTAIIAETELAGAALNIEEIPLMLKCSRCQTTTRGSFGVFVCPTCGGNTTIVSGTELNVIEIELEDEVPESP